MRFDNIKDQEIKRRYDNIERNIFFFKFKVSSRTSGHNVALVKEQCRLICGSTHSPRGRYTNGTNVLLIVLLQAA